MAPKIGWYFPGTHHDGRPWKVTTPGSGYGKCRGAATQPARGDRDHRVEEIGKIIKKICATMEGIVPLSEHRARIQQEVAKQLAAVMDGELSLIHI